MRCCAAFAAVALVALAGCRAGGRVVDRVVIITVDGLMPAVYTEPDAHGLAVPTLRELARAGAASPGALSVFPSVTYPAHTTIATGVDPGTHGIVTNLAPDPGETNDDGWFWYAADIKARTLWDAAAAAHLGTAAVNWPVTVGARIDSLIPEYWRAGTAEDVKLSRALSTRDLLDAVAARHPDFLQGFHPPRVKDAATVDAVVHVLETARPALLMAHIWQTDDTQHGFGPWSPEARAAIENADRQLARVVAAAKAAGAWDRTIVVVASDHGFAHVDRQLRPGVLLRERGLVTLGPDGHPSAWKATLAVNGGLAYFYLADGTDAHTFGALEELLRGLEHQPDSGVGRVYAASEVRARGGDPRAAFAAEAAPGFGFVRGYQGEAYPMPVSPVGQHGYDPERPEMRAALIFAGGAVAPRRLEGARLVDVAPTVARCLGLDLPAATGKVLPICSAP